MALTLEGEHFERSATEEQKRLTTSRTFKVLSTEKESPIAVLALSGLPKNQDEHPDNSSLIVVRRNATKFDDDGNVWIVTCDYEPDSSGFNIVPGDKKPWELPPFNISYGTAIYSKVLSKSYKAGDTLGSPSVDVLNTVNDPFDPPLQTQQYNSIIRFSYNKQYFSPTKLKNYRGTINKSPITVLSEPIAIEKGRINDISAVFKQILDENGEIDDTYYEISCEIEITEQSKFRIEALNRGFYFIDPVDSKKKEIKISAGVLGSAGTTVTEPQLINKTTSDVIQAGGAGQYIEFQDSFAQDWKQLGLPTKQEG